MSILESLLQADHLSRMVRNNDKFSREEKKNEEVEENLDITKSTGETRANLAKTIARYVAMINQNTTCYLGYPENQNLNYDILIPLWRFHLNNGSDPFMGSDYDHNSTILEDCIIAWFAKLWEIEQGAYSAHITTGGTEGNFHGILMGREKFQDGILYTSQDSHYSIFKIARMFRMQCIKINTLISGEIDCVDLKALLLAHKDVPAVINLNIGTTMKGAIDDVDLVIQTLEESGFPHNQFYIHCDGALSGMMLPFLKQAPRINFKKHIGSISVSGHKFLGCPIPCGVVITRLEHTNVLSKDVEYIESRNVPGDHCGLTPIYLWYALQERGLTGLKKEAEVSIMNAHHLLDKLRVNGVGAMLNKFSNTVVFERPQDNEFVHKWNLACKGNISHVVVMQHVTIEIINSFVSELIQKRLTWLQDGQPPCIANDIGEKNCACALHNSFLEEEIN